MELDEIVMSIFFFFEKIIDVQEAFLNFNISLSNKEKITILVGIAILPHNSIKILHLKPSEKEKRTILSYRSELFLLKIV